jgi:hypothetical protein
MKFHPPFNHFGAAIFNDAQKCEEAVLGYYLDKNGCLPKEFAPFCDCSARADYPKHWSKFSYLHKSGIRLYGAPDEVLERKGGGLCVIDHKTAHFRADKDPFHAQYVTQVTGYANIAEGLGLGEVTLAGLMYWEAQVSDVLDNPSRRYVGGKLFIPFTPTCLEIKIDYSILDPLLEELKRVWEAKTSPDGREGCDDCKKLELLLAIDEELQLQDRRVFERASDIRHIRDAFITRDYTRRQLRRQVLFDVAQLGEDAFESTGVVANWDFDQFQTDAELFA